MIIVDRELAELEQAGNPIRVGMIGAGYMARGLARSIASTPGMRLAAVACRTPANAIRVYEELGAQMWVAANDAQGVEAVVAREFPCITESPYALTAAENIDVLVEVTGNVEYGARIRC